MQKPAQCCAGFSLRLRFIRSAKNACLADPKGPARLPQAEEGEDGQDNHDQAYQINNPIHFNISELTAKKNPQAGGKFP